MAYNNRFGCEHYSRNCKLCCPCCDKVYACRFCHDASEDHKLVRSSVKKIECTVCKTKQAVSTKCSNVRCQILFGSYFCSKCVLFDNEDKGQFHCDKCELCRIGGIQNYFHCNTCGICLSKSVRTSHKCIPDISHKDCAVCLEDIHTSRIAAHVPRCGHLLHGTCFKNLLDSGHDKCPSCGEKMDKNVSSLERKLEELIF